MTFKAVSILFAIYAISSSNTYCQRESKDLLPNDTSIRQITLNNGFKFYLKKSAGQKIDVRFVVKVGYNQAPSNNREIPHVQEHMPFIETQHFTQAETFFQQRGILRGTDFNATVSTSNTTYWAKVPAGRLGLLKEVISFYRDCSQGVIMSEKNIEIAKASVINEIQLSGVDFSDPNREQMKVLIDDDKYQRVNQREILAQVKVLKSHDLRRFYEKWYRANLMALVVVGDFDVNEIEEYIHKLFASIKETKGLSSNIESSERKSFQWQDNIIQFHQPGIGQSAIEMYLRAPHVPLKTVLDLDLELAKRLFNVMCQKRYEVYEQAVNRKFVLTFPRYEYDIPSLGPKFDAIVSRAQFTGADCVSILKKVLVENERIRRFGFYEEELDAAKIKVIDDLLPSRANDNENIALQIVKAFTIDSPLFNIWDYKEFVKQRIDKITKDGLDSIVHDWFDAKNNLAIIIKHKEKTWHPITQDTVDNIISNLRKVQIQNFEFKIDSFQELDSLGSLMDSEVVADLKNKLKTTYIATAIDDSTGITTLRFANGIKVICKELQSPAKPGQVYLESVNKSVVIDSLPMQSILQNTAAYMVGKSGLSRFNNDELERFYRQNRIDNFAPYSYNDKSGFIANFNQTNFEEVLQLIYEYIVNPNVDSCLVSERIKELKQEMSEAKRPANTFLDSIDSYKYGENHRVDYSEDDFNSITSKDVLNSYNRRFSITEGHTFVFVGDFVLSGKNMTLMAKYLANIPKKEKDSTLKNEFGKAKLKDKGCHEIVLNNGDQPTSEVRIEVNVNAIYTDQNLVLAKLIEEYLASEIYQRLRNKELGVYGVNFSLSSEKALNQFVYKISFMCQKSDVNRLTNAVSEEMKKLGTNILSDDVVIRIKSKFKSDLESNLNKSSFWLSYITTELPHAKSFNGINRRLMLVDNVSAKDLMEFAIRYIDINCLSKFVLNPAK